MAVERQRATRLLRLTTSPEVDRLDILIQGMAMESGEKERLVAELELKLTALIEEREDVHKKCDSEPDPKLRAIYWIKIGTLDAAIHELRNDIFSRKVS